MYEQAARRALALTGAIIEETGARLAGGEGAKRAARRLAEEASGVCDSVALESFAVHPGAFLGFIRLLVGAYIAAAALMVPLPWASAALTSLGIAILVLEFFLYKEPLDPFFPRLEGINATGVLEPREGAKRQVIVSGHHDSARVFNFYVDRPELYARRLYGGMGALLALWAASLILAFLSGGGGGLVARIVASVAFLACLPLVLPLWNFASSEGTPGAGDNLAASATALEIAREFRARRDAGAGLESTRLIFASFDAEEAGLRGARAFARRRRSEFGSIPTFAFNMDCIYDSGKFRFLLSDINGSVGLDAEATALAAAQAEAEGVKSVSVPIAFMTGGTDAAELAKAGARAVSVLAMDWSSASRASAYHTPADTVEAVDPKAIEAAIRIGIRFVEELDRGSLGKRN
jgi:hypothetical protein